MTPAGDDMQVIGYRLDQLEGHLSAGLAKVDQRLDALEAELKADVREQLKAIRYVSRDVYERDRAHIDERLASTRAIAMWALGSVVAVVVTVLGVLLRSV